MDDLVERVGGGGPGFAHSAGELNVLLVPCRGEVLGGLPFDVVDVAEARV